MSTSHRTGSAPASAQRAGDAAAPHTRAFGALAPLLAPRAVAVLGASDREGNLGGLAVSFLRKFGFAGPVWPVNPGRAEVAGLPCYPTVEALPGVPDLAVVALPADRVVAAIGDCAGAGVPAAVVWAGGFAETGTAGAALQRELEAACRASGMLLCGPNCIGVINTGIGLTASFSSMLREEPRLIPGHVSMVSQSGGIAVMAHARAQAMGLGFRVTVSCGNEAVLRIPDFVHALVGDDDTRVIAVYTEGLSDADAFVAALDAARSAGKPVVVMKGGASEASGRAALAHTGRLAGADRTFDAVLRELAAIRVHSSEELLDVCLQLASMPPGQVPAGNRALVTSFGGGSGVMCTDQCVREGLEVPTLSDVTRDALEPLLTPLSSALNPVDFTPGMVTDARYRAKLPAALDVLARGSDTDVWLFLAAGFGPHAPAIAKMIEHARSDSDKPMCVTWQAMPEGTAKALAEKGLYVFGEHARAARTARHLVRYAANRRHRIRRGALPGPNPAWDNVTLTGQPPVVLPEHLVAAVLADAGLPVAEGRIAAGVDEAIAVAQRVGYPVAVKGLSAAITHRAAAGLVALGCDDADAVRAATQRHFARARELGATLDGIYVQHMAQGDVELLVTALRDADFGVMVGVGVGGVMTELVDDVTFARAPLDVDAAGDLIATLRTVRRHPAWLAPAQRAQAAAFVARFSALAATAPWSRFALEVNPLKLGPGSAVAVDGLLVIEALD